MVNSTRPLSGPGTWVVAASSATIRRARLEQRLSRLRTEIEAEIASRARQEGKLKNDRDAQRKR